jgi:hypothetical protein
MESIIPSDEDIFLIFEEVSQPKAKKSVHFSSESDTFFPTSVTQETGSVKERWYQKEEIGLFKLRVQKFTMATIRGETPNTEKDGSLRGLEHYCNLNRMRRKQMTLSHILREQSNVKGFQLARISEDCTAWHKEIAFVQGLYDYCDVYNPSMASSVPNLPLSPPAFPCGIQSNRKRSAKRRRIGSRLTAE